MRHWMTPVVLAILLVGCAAKAPPASIPAPTFRTSSGSTPPGEASPASAGPSASVPPPTPAMPPVDLTDATLATPQTGFAVDSGGSIYRSEDGGLHWDRLFRDPAAGLWQIQFQNARNGFAKGSARGANLHPVLYTTRDGGEHWNQIEPSLPSGLEEAWGGNTIFPTPGVGYTVTPFGVEGGGGDPNQRKLQAVLLASADGGRTWEARPLPDSYRATGGISFVDAEHGFITALGPKGYVILRTADGGGHWQKVYTSAGTSTGTPAGTPLYTIQMTSDKDGVAAGGWWIKWGISPLQLVLATHDGGATWSEMYRGDDRDVAAIVQIRFVNAQTGWARTGIATLGANGTIVGNLLLTRDGGRTWQKLPEKAQNLAAAGSAAWLLERFDPMGLYPLKKPVLDRTQDNGATWQSNELDLPLAGK